MNSKINIWGDWYSSRDIKPNILENLIKLWRHKYKNIEFIFLSDWSDVKPVASWTNDPKVRIFSNLKEFHISLMSKS